MSQVSDDLDLVAKKTSSPVVVKLSLAKAFKKSAEPIRDTQITYKQNVVAINTLVTSVLSSSLPTLNQNPPDWSDFVTAYTQANADALDWVNNVLARLLDVPGEVQSYNSVISQLLQDALSQANILKNDPSNSSALQILKNDLNSITSQLGIVSTFISGAIKAIQGFQDKLPDMATQLQSIADNSVKDSQADEKKIADLKQDIKNLQADIKSLTASIVALGIADATAISLGTVASIVAFPEGLLTWFVMGPVAAVASTFIALDAAKIVADQKSIQDKQAEMDLITADVSTLQMLSQSFGQLAEETQQVEDNLQAVLQEWQTLESDVSDAISDIQTAISDEEGANYTAVINDLNDAVAEWNDAYSQAGSLFIELNVNNAELNIGMSSEQVKSAFSTGSTVGVIQYYNNL
ncbi:enterotoxin (HBL) [Microbulbifer sp. JTAC008]|uniref:enterotoxin (HBL) n=1 Tax=Microbulbifer sp. JTAC008 TaxID=3243374 RepID=UPI00403A62BB